MFSTVQTFVNALSHEGVLRIAPTLVAFGEGLRLEGEAPEVVALVDQFSMVLEGGDLLKAEAVQRRLRSSIRSLTPQQWARVSLRLQVTHQFPRETRFASDSVVAAQVLGLLPEDQPRYVAAAGGGGGFSGNVVGRFFEKRRVEQAVAALLMLTPNAERFKNLSESQRREALSLLLGRGMVYPHQLRRALPLLPNLSESEMAWVTQNLRQLSFSPQANIAYRGVALTFLKEWSRASAEVSKPSILIPTAPPLGALPEDIAVTEEYFRYRLDEGLSIIFLEPDAFKMHLIHLAFDTSNGYLPREDFPWHQAGLARYAVCLLIDYMGLEKFAHIVRDSTHRGIWFDTPTKTFTLETMLRAVPKIFQTDLITYLLLDLRGLIIQCINLGVLLIQHREIIERWMEIVVGLLNRLSEEQRFLIVEKIVASERGNDFRLGGPFREASNYIFQSMVPLFHQSKNRIQLALMACQLSFWSVSKASPYPGPLLAKDPREVATQLIVKLSKEEREIFWDKLFLEIKSRADLDMLFQFIFPVVSPFYLKDPTFLLQKLEERFRSHGHQITPVDIELFRRSQPGKSAQNLKPEVVIQFSIPIQVLVYLAQNSISLDPFTVVHTVLKQSDPLKYVQQKLEEARQAQDISLSLFPLLVLLDSPKKVQKGQLEILESHLSRIADAEEQRRKEKKEPFISQARRVDIVKAAIEASKRWGSIPSQEFFSLLPRLMNWVTPSMREGLAKSHGIVGEVFRYYISGLPLKVEFYERWQVATDRQKYVEEVGGKIRHYRQGGALPQDPSKEDYYLAHAALDQPAGLDLDSFERELHHFSSPPQIFLPQKLSLDITSLEVSGAIHNQVDKGLLKKAWGPMLEVGDADKMVEYLREVFRNPHRYGLRPIVGQMKEMLQKTAPKNHPKERYLEVIQGDNAFALAKELLKLLDPLQERPQVQKIITRLVLGLAWDLPQAEGLKRLVQEYQRAIPSDKLFMLLRGLQTFYHDTLADVLKEFPNLKSREIEKFRGLLDEQRQKVVAEEGETEEVRVWPWNSQLAIFFGRVAQDCNDIYVAKRVLSSGHFQINILEMGNRIVGLVYLKEATLDSKKVLVIAIQPRSFWKIDRKQLLKAIEEAFSQLADQAGYDLLLFSGKPGGIHWAGQISNDMDLLTAVQQRDYSHWRPQKSLEGNVMTGNNFLVVWKK